jgi:type II secretory pathway component GspD/PulD (secretin)
MSVRINKDEGEYEPFTIFGATKTQFPKVTERFVDTNTVIIDGNTLVMGGLRETREEKGVDSIPFLGRIPLLGWLFRSEYVISQDYELIVFLTPHIIEPEYMITERDRNLYETSTTHADNQTVDPYDRFEPYYDMKHRSQYVSPHGLKTTPGGKSWSVDGPAQWKYW